MLKNPSTPKPWNPWVETRCHTQYSKTNNNFQNCYLKIFSWVESFLRTLLCAEFLGPLPFLSHACFEHPLMHNCEFTIVIVCSLNSCISLPLKILCKFCIFCIGLSIVFFLVHSLCFYTAFICCSSTVSQCTPQTSIYWAKWWRPRGARGKLECSSSYWSGPRGACAFKRYEIPTRFPQAWNDENIRKWNQSLSSSFKQPYIGLFSRLNSR